MVGVRVCLPPAVAFWEKLTQGTKLIHFTSFKSSDPEGKKQVLILIAGSASDL